jgi:uncharacterized protein (TIGR03437 family)
MTISNRNISHRGALILRLASVLILAVCGFWLGLRGQAIHTKTGDPANPLPDLRGQAAVEHLKQEELYDSLAEAVAVAQYNTEALPSRGAYNYSHNVVARWDQIEHEYSQSIIHNQQSTIIDPPLSLQAVLAGNDLLIGDTFGFTVAISGDTAVVGANVSGVIGLVYVFVRNGKTWSEQQKLTVSDGAQFVLIQSVAISGDTLLTGVDIFDANRQGAAFVFVRDGMKWTQQEKLTALDGATGDGFGVSVAIDGETAIVGATGAAGGGAAYVFERSDKSWVQQQKLAGAAGDGFGASVAISADTVVVGANFADGANSDQGVAYVFARVGTIWSLQQKLTASDGATGAGFGFSVAISGETAVVGADRADIGVKLNQGAAYIFVRGGKNWNEQQILTASDGAAFDNFGRSVAISGEKVVVGEDGADIDENRGQGAAYVFARSGTAWTQRQKLTVLGGSADDLFGASAAISEDTVVIGTNTTPGIFLESREIAPGSRAAVGPPGAAFVFAPCPAIIVNPINPVLPAGVFGIPYSQSFMGSSGTVPYNFTVIAGALPPGLILYPDGTLSGAPAASGAFNFTIQATDTFGCAGSRDYTLVINNSTCAAIAINPATLPMGTTGLAYNQTLMASAAVSAFDFSVSRGSLPPGLTLSLAGLLSGTPTSVGLFNFTVQATLANGCAGTRAYTLVINSCLSVDQVTLPKGKAGMAYNQTLTVSGATGPFSFSVSSGSLPPGLDLSSAGLINGTPTSTGFFAFTVQVTAANGCAGVRAYTLVINCPSIIINPATLPAGTLGMPYNQTLMAPGATAPINFSADNAALPPGLTLSSTGLLSGTPTSVGVFTFGVAVNAAFGCSGSRNYTLVIKDPSCPAIIIDPETLPAGTSTFAYNQTLTASGGTPPYNFSVLSDFLPANLTLSPSGTLGGTPIFIGAFNIAVQATDANGCASARNYTLVINRPPCPAITIDPVTLPTGTAGVAYNQRLTGLGELTPFTFSVSKGSLPPGLSLTSTGLLRGTPIAVGDFNFTVQAADFSGCAGMGAYTLTITCPTIAINPATLPTGKIGSAYNQTLTATGANTPIGFTVNTGSLPPGLTLTSAGLLSGSPISTGSFNFTVMATDAFGCMDVTAYIVTIEPSAFVTVSAASYKSPVAPKEIVVGFGSSLAASIALASSPSFPTVLNGTSVKVKDSAGVARDALLFFISPSQINYQIPDGTATGEATVSVFIGPHLVAVGPVQIVMTAPSIFALNASGNGPAAALDALTFAPAPFNPELAEGMPNFIAVWGTGLGADATDGGGNVFASVKAFIDGNFEAQVTYAGLAPGFQGSNQFNIELPFGITSGVHTLTISRGAVISNEVTILIQRE